jgi:hypothetical protein
MLEYMGRITVDAVEDCCTSGSAGSGAVLIASSDSQNSQFDASGRRMRGHPLPRSCPPPTQKKPSLWSSRAARGPQLTGIPAMTDGERLAGLERPVANLGETVMDQQEKINRLLRELDLERNYALSRARSRMAAAQPEGHTPEHG